MKILMTSDWHLDAMTAGKPRIDEHRAYRDKLCDIAEVEDVDIVAFCGDAFDPGQMLGPFYTVEMMRSVEAVHARARYGSIWISGNHDVVESWHGVTTMSPVAILAEHMEGAIHVVEKPDAVRFLWTHDMPVSETGQAVGGVVFLCLPYVARPVYDKTHEDNAIHRARMLAEEDGMNLPIVVIGHMTVPGASLGSESVEMARGRDLDLPARGIRDLKPSVVVNGHYHEPQTVKVNGVNVIIPGSPHRFTFSERNDRKGCVIVEL